MISVNWRYCLKGKKVYHTLQNSYRPSTNWSELSEYFQENISLRPNKISGNFSKILEQNLGSIWDANDSEQNKFLKTYNNLWGIFPVIRMIPISYCRMSQSIVNSPPYQWRGVDVTEFSLGNFPQNFAQNIWHKILPRVFVSKLYSKNLHQNFAQKIGIKIFPRKIVTKFWSENFYQNFA